MTHIDPSAALIPIFWQNAIDGADVYLTAAAREDLSMLGQGSWRRFLWSAADRYERAHGRHAAERMINDACKVLGAACVWIRKGSDIYEAQSGCRLEAEQRSDLVLFIFRRIENRGAA